MSSHGESLTHEDLQKAKEAAEKDIVNQLKKRRAFKLHHGVGDTLLYSIDETRGDPTCEEAAAEITSLRKHIEDLDDLQTILDEQLDKYTAALAEARELLGVFYRADIDMYKYDRTASWLERNR